MAERIPNLWPADKVSVSTLSPVAIMRAQGQYLQEQTLGLLVGEVATVEVGANSRQDTKIPVTYHYLEVVAPTLGGYRRRILRIRQDTALPYPVLYSEAPEEAGASLGFPPDAALQEANTEAEFIAVLTKVFNSGPVLSVVNSLLAQIREVCSGAATETAKLQWDEEVEG